ncbi:diphthine synthase [Rhizophagus irregularis]|uniref:diphthine methyl ester synthase n=1 Tax=Rhizophagus irregularis TaxID=588596 RepID=A0A2I1GC55_9GLOM|nr:diphthine synthase [Rhizophagus irregularis]
MLFIIGLGLSDEKDITIKGLEAIKSCERIYLEAYTSILMVSQEKLEELYGKKLILADREMVESQSDDILLNADKINVAFLVVGDPFGATTHADLIIRAKELLIPIQTIHNASIMNAVGACGLQLYNYGQTISIPFFTDNWRPDSFYDRIKENRNLGLHTLCLLDIKVKEQSIENLARGRKIYEFPRYMTINQAIMQLLEIEENRKQNAYTSETLAIGIARLGSLTEQLIKAGTLNQLLSEDFGPPLHSLIIVGNRMHILEADYMKYFVADKNKFDEIVKRDYKI